MVPRGSEPSEDCLYANVWRPAGARGKLPVLVWIYGGGFVNGAASRPIYTGDRLARHGIVVVSFNYRIGRFGTFAHPALTRADADHGLLANYGFMDQIAAMRWVQKNIGAFGGDPRHVTVMGESAGGMSVHNLMTSPLAQGLFQRAIIASGGDGSFLTTQAMAEAEAIGATFGKEQGIAVDDPNALTKLRALPAEAVLGDVALASVLAPGPRRFSSPLADGRVAVNPGEAYKQGRFQHVPVMIGATSADMGGPDGFMIKGARDLAGVLAQANLPVFYYRFSYVADAARKPNAKGAVHADDLPYYFDTVSVKYGAQTTERDRAMGRIISAYIANFAKTGNPNGSHLPQWPRHAGSGDTMMNFGADGIASPRQDP